MKAETTSTNESDQRHNDFESIMRETTLPREESILIARVMEELKQFYSENPQIKESHGIQHALNVYHHACHAVACHVPSLSKSVVTEILIAALLHDVDDEKYFPCISPKTVLENAEMIFRKAGVPLSSWSIISFMIDSVSCSKHGNSVTPHEENFDSYFWLIPRWADRIEAVGKRGVVRCYQYTVEKGNPLFTKDSPRPKTLEEVAQYASPDRFEAYQKRGGSSTDMISHYYDKLLHVVYPPFDIVCNPYLEAQLKNAAAPLLEVCLRFGRTGTVDVGFIEALTNDAT